MVEKVESYSQLQEYYQDLKNEVNHKQAKGDQTAQNVFSDIDDKAEVSGKKPLDFKKISRDKIKKNFKAKDYIKHVFLCFVTVGIHKTIGYYLKQIKNKENLLTQVSTEPKHSKIDQKTSKVFIKDESTSNSEVNEAVDSSQTRAVSSYYKLKDQSLVNQNISIEYTVSQQQQDDERIYLNAMLENCSDLESRVSNILCFESSETFDDILDELEIALGLAQDLDKYDGISDQNRVNNLAIIDRLADIQETISLYQEVLDLESNIDSRLSKVNLSSFKGEDVALPFHLSSLDFNQKELLDYQPFIAYELLDKHLNAILKIVTNQDSESLLDDIKNILESYDKQKLGLENAHHTKLIKHAESIMDIALRIVNSNDYDEPVSVQSLLGTISENMTDWIGAEEASLQNKIQVESTSQVDLKPYYLNRAKILLSKFQSLSRELYIHERTTEIRTVEQYIVSTESLDEEKYNNLQASIKTLKKLCKPFGDTIYYDEGTITINGKIDQIIEAVEIKTNEFQNKINIPVDQTYKANDSGQNIGEIVQIQPVPKGVHNGNNRCFFISTLQAFNASESLRNLFSPHDNPIDENLDNYPERVEAQQIVFKMLNEINQSESTYRFDSSELIRLYACINKVCNLKSRNKLKDGTQYDASELVLRLFSVINYDQAVINYKNEVTSLEVDWNTGREILSNDPLFNEYKVYDMGDDGKIEPSLTISRSNPGYDLFGISPRSITELMQSRDNESNRSGVNIIVKKANEDGSFSYKYFENVDQSVKTSFDVDSSFPSENRAPKHLFFKAVNVLDGQAPQINKSPIETINGVKYQLKSTILRPWGSTSKKQGGIIEGGGHYTAVRSHQNLEGSTDYYYCNDASIKKCKNRNFDPAIVGAYVWIYERVDE